jgi:hypothetical protein
MKKIFTITLATLLLNIGCKKSNTPAPQSDPATAKMTALLYAGKGIWQFVSSTQVFYDRNNKVLKTDNFPISAFWIFSATNNLPNGITMIEYMETLTAYNTIEDIQFILSIENGDQYLTYQGSSDNSKFKFTTLTATDMTLVTTDVQPLDGADHATSTFVLKKYQ